MAKTITTRLPDKYVAGLKTVAEKEDVDTSTAVRKLLAQALTKWKQDYAVKQYTEGKFSFGQAVEFSEVSVWEFPDLLKEHKLPLNYDLEELQKDLKTIQWKEQ
ncbi:MAG: UPF0175 family protein [Candidatus Woesearchaeota archaeon]|jgi:predicted HTH domain antitoxin|nr:UPF0175 family protein [Candidatus Woesearchaeota archaeon]MDP7180338.1 UPF0175 family protein [Candidatus Woesearchaeota archaeon]MDP7457226.1 UPF0175 family protein [Candidatus Woesearchaeota archaeon]|tara:strand:- start:191 stop:502 length:312 start_codon:yes stop_codon:yes gene_type:complete